MIARKLYGILPRQCSTAGPASIVFTKHDNKKISHYIMKNEETCAQILNRGLYRHYCITASKIITIRLRKMK